MKDKNILDKGIFFILILLAVLVPFYGANLKYLWILLGVLWILKGRPSLKNPLLLPVAAYVSLSLISALCGTNVPASFRYILKHDVNILMFFIVADSVRERKNFSVLTKIFLMSATSLCLFTILDFIFRHNASVHKIFEFIGFQNTLKAGRVFATRAHPLIFANNLTLYIPLMAAVALVRKRFFYFFGIFLMIATLILTYSRGPVIYLFAVFAVATIFFFRKMKMFSAVVVAGVIAAIFLINFSKGMSIKKRLNFNAPGRFLLWKASLKMAHDYPLFGVGAGNAIEVYEKSYWQNKSKFYHFHNVFIQVFVERGIFTFLAFLWFIYLIFRTLYLRIRCEADLDFRFYLTGYLFSFAAFFMAGFTDFIFYRAESYFPFYFLLGLAVSRAFSNAPER